MTEERNFVDDAPVSYVKSLDTTSWFDPSTMPSDGSNFIALFAEDENDYESAESVYKMADGTIYYSVDDDKVVNRHVIAWSPMPKINRYSSSRSSTG